MIDAKSFLIGSVFVALSILTATAICQCCVNCCGPECTSKCCPAPANCCPPDCGPRLEKLERAVFKTGAEQPE